MKDKNKTKDQLIKELVKLRRRINESEELEAESKRVEGALEKKILALTQPVGELGGLTLTAIIGVKTLQELQDNFARYHDVASIILDQNGEPITEASNLSEFCSIIRSTPKGLEKCIQSDERLGKMTANGSPAIISCQNFKKILDGAVPIYIKEKYLGSWCIGQVLTEKLDIDEVLRYASEIGADENRLVQASEKFRIGPEDQFKKIVAFLDTMAKNLSLLGLQNLQQARYIAERKRMEEELLKSEAKLGNILSAARKVSIIGTDLNGEDAEIIFFNKGAENIFGYKEEEIVGKPVAKLHLSEDIEKFPEVIEAMKKGKEGFTGESILVRKNGEKFPAAFNTFPLKAKDGEMYGTVGISIDITESKRVEEALREAKKLLDKTFASLDQAVFVVDPATRTIINCNPAVERIFGYSEEQVIGRNTEFLHVDRAMYEKFGRELFPALDKSGVYHTEFQMRRKDGSVFFSEHTVTEIVDDSGQRTSTVSVVSDITKRTQVEVALQETEKRFRRIVETSQEGIWVIDSDAKTEYVNKQMAEMLGYTTEEMLGRSFFDFMDDTARFEAERYFERRKQGIKERHDFRFRRKDGSDIWMIVSTNPIFNNKGEFIGALGMIVDITSRKQAEDALMESERQLRAISARLAEVEDAERKALAQELHDSVGQNLSALNINLNIMQRQLLSQSTDKIGSRLSDSMNLVEETTKHIRDVMAELRPEVLDDYGLMAALRWCGERFSERTGLETVIQGEELTTRLPLNTETVLFRIAQEAMTNVAKHARADQVTVALEGVGDLARLTIADDGVGFDLSDLGQPRERKGWGITTMQERSRSLGGQFRIESDPGKGTRVMVEVKR